MTVELSIVGCQRTRYPVENFAAASRVVRAFIDENGIGSSEWSGGAIRDGRRLVARVSYNGRVWDLAGKEITP